MTQYSGEDWILQVDSHTRFAADWDVRLIDAAAMTGAAKPLLSCYPPSYDPTVEFTGAGNPTELFVHGGPTTVFPSSRSERSRTLPANRSQPSSSPPGSCSHPDRWRWKFRTIRTCTSTARRSPSLCAAYTLGYDLFHPDRGVRLALLRPHGPAPTLDRPCRCGRIGRLARPSPGECAPGRLNVALSNGQPLRGRGTANGGRLRGVLRLRLHSSGLDRSVGAPGGRPG